MTPRRTPAKRRASYHRGGLRKTLLDASLQLLETDGAPALSLREVARRAGVTHGAPYYHFKDKQQLLDAIAEAGFAQLRDQMIASRLLRARADERLAMIGRAYVRFALENRSCFQVMFRTDTAGAARGPAAAQAFQVMVEAVEAAQAEGLAPPGDPNLLVLLVWSAVHGLSSLWLSGALHPSGAEEPLGSPLAGQLSDLLARLFALNGASEKSGPAPRAKRR